MRKVGASGHYSIPVGIGSSRIVHAPQEEARKGRQQTDIIAQFRVLFLFTLLFSPTHLLSTHSSAEEYEIKGEKITVIENEGNLELSAGAGYGRSMMAKDGFTSIFSALYNLNIIKGISVSPGLLLSFSYFNTDLFLDVGNVKLKKIPIFSGVGLRLEERKRYLLFGILSMLGPTVSIQKTIQKWEAENNEWKGKIEWSYLFGAEIGYFHSPIESISLKFLYNYNRRDPIFMLDFGGSIDVKITVSN